MDNLELEIPTDADYSIEGSGPLITHFPNIILTKSEIITTGRRRIQIGGYRVLHPERDNHPFFGGKAYRNSLLLYQAEGRELGPIKDAIILDVLNIPKYLPVFFTSRKANNFLYEKAKELAMHWQETDSRNNTYRDIVDCCENEESPLTFEPKVFHR